MGNRALIHFVDAVTSEISPATYLHWGGDHVGELLRATFEVMRTRGADVGYTAARFVGICHKWMDGNLSLGILNAPDGGLDAVRAPEYSHGNAGVFIVHQSASGWEIEMHGGYGVNEVFLELGEVDQGRLRWSWEPGQDASFEEIAMAELAKTVTRGRGARRSPKSGPSLEGVN